MTRQQRIGLGFLTVSVAFALGYVIRARAGGIPTTNVLSYSGYIQNGAGPLTGSHTIEVTFYNAASGGSVIDGCQTSATVTVTGGYFSVPLPLPACQNAVAQTQNVWVDVVVDGSDVGTTQVGAVPYAVEANHAVNADNATDAGTLGSTIASLQSNVSTAQSNVTTLQGNVSTIDANLVARLSAMDVSMTSLGSGSVNGSTTQLLVQGGTFVADANLADAGAGNVVVPFKATFPSGLLTVVATSGDQADGPMEVIGWNTSNFTVHADSTTSGDCRVNWIAIGW